MSPKFKSPIECFRIRIWELPSPKLATSHVKHCSCAQSPFCRTFHLSPHILDKGGPGTGRRQGHWYCPEVITLVHILCDPQRRPQGKRLHSEWAAIILMDLTREEKEAELRVRSWLPYLYGNVINLSTHSFSFSSIQQIYQAFSIFQKLFYMLWIQTRWTKQMTTWHLGTTMWWNHFLVVFSIVVIFLKIGRHGNIHPKKHRLAVF